MSLCSELLVALDGPCASETAALIACLPSAGLHCNDNGDIKASTDACNTQGDAWDSCVRSITPTSGCTNTTKSVGTAFCSTDFSNCSDGNTYGVTCDTSTGSSQCFCTSNGSETGQYPGSDCPADFAAASSGCGWSVQ